MDGRLGVVRGFWNIILVVAKSLSRDSPWLSMSSRKISRSIHGPRQGGSGRATSRNFRKNKSKMAYPLCVVDEIGQI